VQIKAKANATLTVDDIEAVKAAISTICPDTFRKLAIQFGEDGRDAVLNRANNDNGTILLLPPPADAETEEKAPTPEKAKYGPHSEFFGNLWNRMVDADANAAA
jgi:hypothetical protein